MKILILTSFNVERYTFDRNNCTTRSQLWAFLIYIYLKEMDNEILVMQCIPGGTKSISYKGIKKL